METFSIVLVFLCGFFGSWFACFVAPFSTLSGYKKQGLSYLVTGVALLAIAYGLGTTLALLLVLLAVTLAAFVAFYLLTVPGIRLLPKEGDLSVDGITTIEDAVAACRGSGLQGWALIVYAQGLAAKKFTYCRQNPWDSPSRAFERGLGYCQQQALALNEIFDRLGIASRPMFANKCRFPPPGDASDSLALAIDNRWLRAWFESQENVFGHTWLRVHVGDKELDVCPGDPNNQPGMIHFEPLSQVRTLWPFLQPLMHLGAAWANLLLEREARRLRLEQA